MPSGNWPKSRIGMSTGLCRITGRETFCVMKVYFDGSTGRDGNSDEWITLAAIAATDAVWAEFDAKWEEMLHARYPMAPYIHMIELLGSEDPFELQAGWSIENKQRLVDDAIMLLGQVKKDEIHFSRCSINESARQRLLAEDLAVTSDPLRECAGGCLLLTAGTYAQNVSSDKKEPLYVFYDRGERFLSKFKQAWIEKRTRPGKPKNPNNWWDQFTNVQEDDSPYCAPLQVADMIAWSHTRSLSEKDRPFSNLKDLLLKVIPSTTRDIDESFMRDNAHLL